MWPNGKKCAVVLTFDFDAEALFVEGEPLHTVTPTKLSQGEYGARVGMPRILKWLKQRELPATFFIPGVTAEKYPHLVDEVVKNNYEIAHHGYTHAEPFSMSEETERQDLLKGIEVLEQLTGKKPTGYRAPSWAPSHMTMPLLEEMGFLYDASLLGDERPYLIEGTKGLVEIPSDWCLDDAPHYFFNFSPRYRAGLSGTDKVIQIWKDEFDGIYEDGGCYVLAMHPQISGRSHRLKALGEVVEYIQQHDVWFTTMEEVAMHWIRSERK
jgi:peptidoglycan/xylan/chitin deacetylase (PgdA/CDA1 family)